LKDEELKTFDMKEKEAAKKYQEMHSRMLQLENDNADLKSVVSSKDKEASLVKEDLADHATQREKHVQQHMQKNLDLEQRIATLQTRLDELDHENKQLHQRQAGFDISHRKLSQELMLKEEELRGEMFSFILIQVVSIHN